MECKASLRLRPGFVRLINWNRFNRIEAPRILWFNYSFVNFLIFVVAEADTMTPIWVTFFLWILNFIKLAVYLLRLTLYSSSFFLQKLTIMMLNNSLKLFTQHFPNSKKCFELDSRYDGEGIFFNADDGCIVCHCLPL